MNSYIPDKLYCSFGDFYRTKELKGTVLVGYMTPDGLDPSAIKRKRTIQSYGNNDYKSLSFLNDPLHGFKFHGFKYSSTGDGYAWIKDPRGFVTIVKLSDFGELMKQVTMRNGEIMKECIWVRDGRYNKLITKDSKQYQESKKLTEGLKNNYKFKDLKINDVVTLKDKVIGRFLGSFNLFGLHSEEKSTVDCGQDIYEINNVVKALVDKSRFRCVLVNNNGKEKVLLYKNFTIMNIEETSDNIETLDEYEDWLNVSLVDNSVEFEFKPYGYQSNTIIGFTTKKPETINYKMDLKEIHDKNSLDNYHYRYMTIKPLLTKDNDGYYSVHKNYNYGSTNIQDDIIGTKIEIILEGDELYSEISYKNSVGYHNRFKKLPNTEKKFTSSNIKLYSMMITWDNVITKKTYKRICV